MLSRYLIKPRQVTHGRVGLSKVSQISSIYTDGSIDFTVEEDASMEGLDNIADGQLYRMRRGVSSTNSSHLPPRGGRHARGRSVSFVGGHMNRGQRGQSSNRGHSPSRGARGHTAG